jgi:hypothetical protein
LELYTGQTFEQRRSQFLTNTSGFNEYFKQLHDLDAASQWLNNAREELSAAYGHAIQHCVRSYFDPISTKQDENALRRSVLEQVVVPLQEELQIFLGDVRRI